MHQRNFSQFACCFITILTAVASFGQTPDEWVTAHNKYRRVLTGYDGKPTSTPDLIWSDALAKDAKEWADKVAASGNFVHRPNSSQSQSPDARPYGENLGAGYSGIAMVDAFVVNERPFFHPLTSKCKGGVCGHYTQVISQLSREVGCANATAANGTIYGVCNYTPHGNLQVDGGGYSELYPNQQPPVPGGPMFVNLNREAQLDLRFNECLRSTAAAILNTTAPQGATDIPAACTYTKLRAYDSGSDSGLMGYTGTADDAGGYLIGMFFKGKVLGVFGAVAVSTNPLRAVLVTGE